MKSPAINQAMDILRQLRHISEGPDTLPVKLDKIITMIVGQMQADAGACYLVVDDNYLELLLPAGLMTVLPTRFLCASAKAWSAMWPKTAVLWRWLMPGSIPSFHTSLKWAKKNTSLLSVCP